ncbi:MAG: hypothetical protein HDQ96_05970 [Lachnospiraceae bacterium]|nr:hypothetical protein [Lachnospiraceae bacterium]
MGMMIGANGVVIRTANPYGTKKNSARPAMTATKKKKKYKKLNYNYREVSGRILRAKTSGSARQTVTHARTVMAMLRRKYGTGEYNEKDVEIAIIHAEKMIRIAKKKLKNLKMEEQAKRTSEAEKLENEREEENSAQMAETQTENSEMSEEKLREMIRQMEKELQELEAENSLDDMMDECLGGSGNMSEEELKLMKKKHRCDEMRQIVEADMKYLKAMFQRMMQEQQEIASAATLELGGAMVNAPAAISLAAGGAQTEVQGGSLDTSV